MTHIKMIEGVTFIGTSLSVDDAYCGPERQVWKIVAKQISESFAEQSNLLISTTWFGPQFPDFPGWQGLMELSANQQVFDNVFFLATVDPCYLTVTDLQWVKNSVKALRCYCLGNFDNHFQFNFFSVQLAENFRRYREDEILLKSADHIFINYNRKPKPHRVNFVRRLIAEDLIDYGVVTLGKSTESDLYFTIGEKQSDYVGTVRENFGLPMDYYTVHRLDFWQTSFLYINAATEFNPVNDLFCQQDTFKPLLGMRPFVINGVQRTYRWLRSQGFHTFNHYWPHIKIENGNVHDTLIELIRFLQSLDKIELLAMYNAMLPELRHNLYRFYEFAQEQNHKLHNLFKHQ